MIKQILYKIFKLEPEPCLVCDALREQLTISERERRELLQRVLAPSTPQIEVESKEQHVPVTPPFIPWRLRQQMLEAEDAKKAELMKAKSKEINESRKMDESRKRDIEKLEQELLTEEKAV